MSDIVERLRERATNGDGWTTPVAADALAEIERLRAALKLAEECLREAGAVYGADAVRAALGEAG